MAGSVITQTVLLSRLVGSPQDMARKAQALLADRFAPAKVKHKPLSILRQEARRALESLFDNDFPTVKKATRDQMIEDILGEAIGFGPLEELFREEANKEVMVLAANQVIAKKGETWLPTSVRFRDGNHLRSYLQKLAETAEPVSPTPAATGAFDVRLPNGFRAIGILPPSVMEQPPIAVFVRGEPQPPRTDAPLARSGPIMNMPRPLPSDGGSSTVPVSATGRLPTPPTGGLPISPPVGPPLHPEFKVFSGPLSPSREVQTLPGSITPGTITPDPYARIRQRVTERIVRKCAAAGVYDMSVIPGPELQRIILAHIDELNGVEKLGMDESLRQRLTLEILASMNRKR
jgi:hypothetical protein